MDLIPPILMANGNNLRLVQKMLEHASISKTQIYADICDSDTRRVFSESIYS